MLPIPHRYVCCSVRCTFVPIWNRFALPDLFTLFLPVVDSPRCYVDYVPHHVPVPYPVYVTYHTIPDLLPSSLRLSLRYHTDLLLFTFYVPFDVILRCSSRYVVPVLTIDIPLHVRRITDFANSLLNPDLPHILPTLLMNSRFRFDLMRSVERYCPAAYPTLHLPHRSPILIPLRSVRFVPVRLIYRSTYIPFPALPTTFAVLLVILHYIPVHVPVSLLIVVVVYLGVIDSYRCCCSRRCYLVHSCLFYAIAGYDSTVPHDYRALLVTDITCLPSTHTVTLCSTRFTILR